MTFLFLVEMISLLLRQVFVILVCIIFIFAKMQNKLILQSFLLKFPSSPFSIHHKHQILFTCQLHIKVVKEDRKPIWCSMEVFINSMAIFHFIEKVRPQKHYAHQLFSWYSFHNSPQLNWAKPKFIEKEKQINNCLSKRLRHLARIKLPFKNKEEKAGKLQEEKKILWFESRCQNQSGDHLVVFLFLRSDCNS